MQKLSEEENLSSLKKFYKKWLDNEDKRNPVENESKTRNVVEDEIVPSVKMMFENAKLLDDIIVKRKVKVAVCEADVMEHDDIFVKRKVKVAVCEADVME